MDGMTIDEVIRYFDDDAKENAKLAKIYTGNDDDLAEMHKQDANRSAYVSVWLRELQRWREFGGRIANVCASYITEEQKEKLLEIMEVNADEEDSN